MSLLAHSLVFGKRLDSLSWNNGVGAKSYVVGDTLSKPPDVLTVSLSKQPWSSAKASCDHLLILGLTGPFVVTPVKAAKPLTIT